MNNRPTLTAEQRAILAPYADQLHRAHFSNWAKPVLSVELDAYLTVWKQLTGSDRTVQKGCGRCILRLLQDLGTLYFAEGQETPAEGTNAAEVEKTTTEVKKPAKKDAKTKKKK